MFLPVKIFASVFNRIRLGFPGHYFQGAGGIGDDLMCTAVFRELKKRGSGRIAMATQYPDLFKNNADVDALLCHSRPRINRWLREGLPFVRLGYAEYDSERDADTPPPEHILANICRTGGITGAVHLRPYMDLSREELAIGKLADRQIVIQSSGLAAAHAMRNKEWYPQRFQEVCTALGHDFKIVQLGASGDPKLDVAIDMRGKTSLRQSAAMLANALVFIGQVGGMMHLARAVDCRGVILYGGREHPSQTGYIANQNLYSPVECSPCWLRNSCDYDRKCMDRISVEQVITSAKKQIALHGEPLEVETASL